MDSTNHLMKWLFPACPSSPNHWNKVKIINISLSIVLRLIRKLVTEIMALQIWKVIIKNRAFKLCQVVWMNLFMELKIKVNTENHRNIKSPKNPIKRATKKIQRLKCSRTGIDLILRTKFLINKEELVLGVHHFPVKAQKITKCNTTNFAIRLLSVILSTWTG